MNKLLITLTLAFLSTSTMAAWTRVTKSDVFGVTAYADHDTIQKSGNKLSIWTLNDFNVMQEVDGVKYLSIKTQEEFNCDNGQTRSLMHIAYSGNMENGQVVNSYEKTDTWRPVKPGSIGERQSKEACGKR
ncbi:MAG: surface-adhesin E family protein [Thiobacillus sp.]